MSKIFYLLDEIYTSTRHGNRKKIIGYRILGPIHTLRPTSFALKTHQMFSVVTTSEEFKKAAITHHFGFVFENNTK